MDDSASPSYPICESQIVTYNFCVKLKHKVNWKSFNVSLNCLFKYFRFNTIHCRIIAVKYHLPTACIKHSKLLPMSPLLYENMRKFTKFLPISV